MVGQRSGDETDDAYSIHSSSSLAESVRPLTEEQPGRRRASSQATSVFSSRNADNAFPDIEADQNPLTIMTTAQLERELEEAKESDAREENEVLPTRLSWKKRLLFLLERLRPDFFLLHHDVESLKVVSRTWIQLFVAVVLMVIPAFDIFVGPAAFLVVLFGTIEASGGISVAHAFYTGIVDMIFVLTAFAFTAIGSAIGWSIRGYPTVQGLMQELADEGVCALNDQTCFMHQVHKGRYLNTKSTVMMLIMMAISMFLCGFMQTWNRAFTVSWIISAICTVITGTYLLLTPNFNPWMYGGAVVKPVGISLSARMVVSMLYFPVSSNYKFFSTIIRSLRASKGILVNDISNLKSMKPGDPEFAKKTEELSEKINKSLGMFALLKLESIFLRGEISYSRLDPGNLGEFRSDARALLNSLAGIRFFFGQIVEKHGIITGIRVSKDSEKNESSDSNEENTQDYPDSKEGNGYATASGANTGREDEAELRKRNHSIDSLPRTHQGSPELDQKASENRFSDLLPQDVPHLIKPSRVQTFSEPLTPSKSNHWFEKKLNKTYVHAGNFEEQRLLLAETIHWDNMRMEDLEALYSHIVSHYEPVSKANIELLSEIIDWAVNANDSRIWTLLPSVRKKRATERKAHNEKIAHALQTLKDLLHHRNEKDFAEWVHKYSKPELLRSKQHYIYLLSMDAFYCEVLETLASNTMRIASYCLLLDDYRPDAGIIQPFMASMSLSPRFESEYNNFVNSDLEGAADVNAPYQALEPAQARNPDASPPRTVVHLIGLRIEKAWHVMTDARVVFCLKRALLGIATTLTFASRKTVFFSYSQRIVWVPIMVILTVSYQAVDGVYGFLTKMVATFVGSLLGMIIWYMGDGHGSGNSYGFAAALTVIMLPVLWYRHYHTLAIPMGAIIACVSAILVSGTSWASGRGYLPDTEIGYGFSVAWRRFASVVVGIAIAFVGTILPHPITAKKQLRLLLGQCLEDLGEVQSGLSNFMIQRAEDPRVHIVPRLDLISKRLRGTKVRIASIQQLMRLIKYEPPLGGVWPRNRMELLVKLVKELVFLADTIYHLIDALGQTVVIPVIRQRLGWASIEVTSGLYSVITMTSKALMTGDPLPSVTTGHLSEQYSRNIRAFLKYDAAHCNKGLEGLLEDHYSRRDGRITLALVTTVGAYYKRLDFCVHLVKGLVGEKYAIDQSSLQADNEQQPLIWPDYARE